MPWLQQTIHSEARGVFIYFITRTGTVLWLLSSSSSIIESATRLDCCSTFTFRKEQLIHHNRFIQLIEGNDWFPFVPALTSLHSKVHIQKLICCTTFWQKAQIRPCWLLFLQPNLILMHDFNHSKAQESDERRDEDIPSYPTVAMRTEQKLPECSFAQK